MAVASTSNGATGPYPTGAVVGDGTSINDSHAGGTVPVGALLIANRSFVIAASLGPPIVEGPATASTGATLSFTATPTGGSAPYAFRWSFGDSAMGNGPSAVHAYSSAGSYHVVVTVTDAVGETANGSLLVVVSAPASWVVPVAAAGGIVLTAAAAFVLWNRRRRGTAPTNPALKP